MGRSLVLVGALALAFAVPAAARADDIWLPHGSSASWTWKWTDSLYNTTPTLEKITVQKTQGPAFVLAWTTKDLGNPDSAAASEGVMSFQETNAGLTNVDWQSTPPPSSFPILCASASQCGNSVASVLYQLVWGSRSPVLAEPLVKGATWSSSGGANNDVTSVSTYLGQEQVSVPAFPQPVTAAKVRTDVTQAGAIGDPYGSGTRTIWWVAGVGPVKILFAHAGGTNPAVTTSELQSTNQQPSAVPTDADWFPMAQGTTERYRWTNSKWMKKPSVQEFTVSQAANQSARVDVKHISGPIKVAGSYGFALRTDGLTNIWGATKAATIAKFPPLGPSSLPKSKRRHFFTPFDLMVYGVNPILTANATAGSTWSVQPNGRDFSIFGASATSKVLGLRRVKVPAGTFTALVVQTTLNQPGFPFGSGVRTSYFADGKGLVKLVFRHRDHSVSTVELLK